MDERAGIDRGARQHLADLSCMFCPRSDKLARGLCPRHYSQHHREGTLESVALPHKPNNGGARCDLWANITSHSAHERVRRLWGPASRHLCIKCGGPAKEWAYDGTDPSQLYGATGHGYWAIYSRFPEFYMPMCQPCHRRRDGSRARWELHAYRVSQMTPKPRPRRRARNRPPNRAD